MGLGLFSAFMKVFNVLCYDIHTLLSWNNKTPALTSFFKNIFRHEQKKLMHLLKHQSCKKSFSWVSAVRCFFWFCSVFAVMTSSLCGSHIETSFWKWKLLRLSASADRVMWWSHVTQFIWVSSKLAGFIYSRMKMFLLSLLLVNGTVTFNY